MARSFRGVCVRYRTQVVGDVTTIQDTPKRSLTIPKRGEKKVLASGIFTCPPLLSPLKARSASASVLTWIDSVTPLNPRLSALSPSVAMIWVSPILKHECMILLSQLGGTLSGGGGFSLN